MSEFEKTNDKQILIFFIGTQCKFFYQKINIKFEYLLEKKIYI